MPRKRNDWNASRVDIAKAPGHPSRYRYVFLLALSTFLDKHTIVTRSRYTVMRSSTLVQRAGLALVSFTTFFLPTLAQTSTPTAAWAPAPTCSQGSSDLTQNGGKFTDRYGNLWDSRCTQTLSGAIYVTDLGTNGQGFYGCAKACAKRPLCTAFTFIYSGTTVNGPKTGSGKCYLRQAAGSYSPDAGTYAAAHLISAGNGLPVSVLVISCADYLLTSSV